MIAPSQKGAGPWRRRIVAALISLLALGALLLTGLTLFEERMIFFPTRELTTTPRAMDLEHEELLIPTSDGETIHGYYVTPSGGTPPRAHLLFSHGNGGNVSRRLPLVADFVEEGLAVLLYDYRGYGRSTGAPTEQGVYRDAEAAYAALLERAGDEGRIVLYGRSLGGGVTWEMASRHRDVAGVVTDATFTSIPDMARALGFGPIARLVRSRMGNIDRVSSLDMPKLLLHGTDDELIPFEMGERLHSAARQPVTFVPLPGAGHNNTFLVDPARYLGAITSFVDAVVRPGTVEQVGGGRR